MSWAVVAGTGGAHVIPQNDVIAHVLTDCPCGPSDRPIPREDGSMGWVTTHHSLDGREANE